MFSRTSQHKVDDSASLITASLTSPAPHQGALINNNNNNNDHYSTNFSLPSPCTSEKSPIYKPRLSGSDGLCMSTVVIGEERQPIAMSPLANTETQTQTLPSAVSAISMTSSGLEDYQNHLPLSKRISRKVNQMSAGGVFLSSDVSPQPVSPSKTVMPDQNSPPASNSTKDSPLSTVTPFSPTVTLDHNMESFEQSRKKLKALASAANELLNSTNSNASTDSLDSSSISITAEELQKSILQFLQHKQSQSQTEPNPPLQSVTPGRSTSAAPELLSVPTTKAQRLDPLCYGAPRVVESGPSYTKRSSVNLRALPDPPALERVQGCTARIPSICQPKTPPSVNMASNNSLLPRVVTSQQCPALTLATPSADPLNINSAPLSLPPSSMAATHTYAAFSSTPMHVNFPFSSCVVTSAHCPSIVSSTAHTTVSQVASTKRRHASSSPAVPSSVQGKTPKKKGHFPSKSSKRSSGSSEDSLGKMPCCASSSWASTKADSREVSSGSDSCWDESTSQICVPNGGGREGSGSVMGLNKAMRKEERIKRLSMLLAEDDTEKKRSEERIQMLKVRFVEEVHEQTAVDTNKMNIIHSGQFMSSRVWSSKSSVSNDLNQLKSLKELKSNYFPDLKHLFTHIINQAYHVRQLISPKWKTFRGIDLDVPCKVRLNNLIWRCWHLQFLKRVKHAMCSFIVPSGKEQLHGESAAHVLEGKYWRRQDSSVISEYMSWRWYYKIKNSAKLRSKGSLSKLCDETRFVGLQFPKQHHNLPETFVGGSNADFIQNNLSQFHLVLPVDLLDIEPFQPKTPLNFDFLDDIGKIGGFETSEAEVGSPSSNFFSPMQAESDNLTSVEVAIDSVTQLSSNESNDDNSLLKDNNLSLSPSGGPLSVGANSSYSNASPTSISGAANNISPGFSRRSMANTHEQQQQQPCDSLLTSTEQILSSMSASSANMNSLHYQSHLQDQDPELYLERPVGPNAYFRKRAMSSVEGFEANIGHPVSRYRRESQVIVTSSYAARGLMGQLPVVVSAGSVATGFRASDHLMGLHRLEHEEEEPLDEDSDELSESGSEDHHHHLHQQQQSSSHGDPMLLSSHMNPPGHASSGSAPVFTSLSNVPPPLSSAAHGDSKPPSLNIAHALGMQPTGSAVASSQLHQGSGPNSSSIASGHINAMLSAYHPFNQAQTTATHCIRGTPTSNGAAPFVLNGHAQSSSGANNLMFVQTANSMSAGVSVGNVVVPNRNGSSSSPLALIMRQQAAVAAANAQQVSPLTPSQSSHSGNSHNVGMLHQHHHIPTVVQQMSPHRNRFPSSHSAVGVSTHSPSGSESAMAAASIAHSAPLLKGILGQVHSPSGGYSPSSSTGGRHNSSHRSSPEKKLMEHDELKNLYDRIDPAVIKYQRLRDKTAEELTLHKERREKVHQISERKRRHNIQVALNHLQEKLPPSSEHNKQCKTRAVILTRASAYIESLEEERDNLRKNIFQMRDELNKVNHEIQQIHRLLPPEDGILTESGGSVVGVGMGMGGSVDNADHQFTVMRQQFQNYVSENSQNCWSFFIFSHLARRFFDSFINTVKLNNVEKFAESVSAWIQHHCTMVNIRAVVTESLTELCVKEIPYASNAASATPQQNMSQRIPSQHGVISSLDQLVGVSSGPGGGPIPSSSHSF